MIERAHIPVLVKEVLDYLISEKFSLFIDATVGGGGHAFSILGHHSKIKLIGLDVDEAGLAIAARRLQPFGERVRLIRGNFRDLKDILAREGIDGFDAILFDLGLSMYHLQGKRGFSFYDDSFLDMRMDNQQEKTAFDVVNRYSTERLENILLQYGEEYRARAIAKAIVYARKKKPITTALELSSLILRVKGKKGRTHPATKAFQAIRIEVNRELENIVSGLRDAIEMCRPGGRIGVISFHSLEDRIIKNTFRADERIKVITKKPLKPSMKEIKENPASRSAKLRVAEKI
ncbi:MAG TPA: 16S rRNA (cytosine(1402)-N(4))-methyltransferase RsmH [Syntrophorhabdaceae bacterium]|nr:16S rRNA (cytosine(1402)-N(4))-methyltransferase RsmH [Syntrophorhabdaceae bacterium]HOT42551.1 16S rRNA (cytosine(1402)-N(4))-methyltransferase RsmH [Syntrophorhabdaceae bacterium]HPC66341.1 16S rRNA (cytosine(1402)-N(4))-methyltransferase RsmH [Syntrophorhabdaceae bacterium]HQE80675.1 16S rRNA (cytosine(1402)-N(4))-methyltransferase RsmH [Syntrophorhabdaceae bacterium]HQH43783.1 16S rRNA (cytosine(1402)-N(4))-methyltransferase RsmH [Syntrophorhabdaceae bacterium]